MKKADKLIIEQNPGKNPQELLTLGLSPAGYTELITSQSSDVSVQANSATFPQQSNIPTMPVLKPILGGNKNIQSKTVRIAPAVNGKPTGSGALMNRDRAYKMKGRNPQNWYIHE